MRFSIPKRSKFLSGLSRSDQTVLAICVGISFFFWLLVKLSAEYDAEKDVRLDYRLPEAMAFTEAPPRQVVATIQGTGWNLLVEFLVGRHIRLEYQASAEDAAFNLSRSRLRSDIADRLSSDHLLVLDVVNFDGLQLQLEAREQRRVPVRPRHAFTYAPEHQPAEGTILEPDSVTITGPASELRTISSWPTDSLSVENLSSDYVGTVGLQEPPPTLSLQPDQVRVEQRVEQFTEKTLFVPVTIRNPPADSVRIFPDKVKLTCVVGLHRYDSLSSSEFTLVADLSTARLDAGKNTASLELVNRPNYVQRINLARRSVEFFLVEPRASDENDEDGE